MQTIAQLMDRGTMYQREPSWKALGVTIPDPSKTDVFRALEAAGLANWNVHTEDMFLESGKKVPHRKAIVRGSDNVVLATSGGNYTALQNEEAFGVMQPACEKFGMTIEGAGPLGIGDKVWMLGKLPSEMSVEPVRGDVIATYLLLTSGHNGKTKWRAKPMVMRLVCTNGMVMTEALGQFASFTHHSKIKDNLKLVEKIILNLGDVMERTGETFSKFVERKLTFEQTQAYVAEVLGIDEDEVEELADENPVLASRFERIMALADHGTGQEFAPHTLWSAFNGVTEYIDHVRPTEAGTTKGIISANRSAMFGKNAKLKNRALQIATKMVH